VNTDVGDSVKSPQEDLDKGSQLNPVSQNAQNVEIEVVEQETGHERDSEIGNILSLLYY
jgi:hypothetical protein